MTSRIGGFFPLLILLISLTISCSEDYEVKAGKSGNTQIVFACKVHRALATGVAMETKPLLSVQVQSPQIQL